MKSILALVFLFSSIVKSSIGQQRFELADYSGISNLSEPQISPDGKSVLMVISTPDYEKNVFESRLVRVDVKSKSTTILVKGKASIIHPRWSPDGKHIAFLAKDTSDKKSMHQLYLLDRMNDAVSAITGMTNGVQQFTWAPNSSDIAFVTADESPRKKEIERGFTAFEVGNNDMFLTAEPVSAHIWMISRQTRKPERLTRGSWTLPQLIPPAPPTSPLSFSPDGKELLFIKTRSPYSGESPYRSVHKFDFSDSSILPLTGRESLESHPAFSPDGSKVAYWYKKDGNSEDINQVWIADSNGKNSRCISSNLDRDLYRSVWLPDGKSLLVGGHNDNKTSVWRLDLSGKFVPCDLGSVCPAWSFWMDINISGNGSFVFIGSEPDHPAELYYMESVDAKPVRLTDIHSMVASRTMGRTVTLRWKTDGWDHSGILTYPVNHDPSKRYPMVLIIHGGPAAASVEQFSRLTQVFANKGYFVFEPNYRGSDNQGSKYKLAIVADAAPGPGRDIMDGVNMIKRMGLVDTSRIGVSGWSYGGFMTVWLAGHYQGWTAAMAGAAVTDLADQYNLSDYSVNRANAMGGSPWVGDNMKRYIEQSPITNAPKIKAPTLILANTGDQRVPVNQSYKLFHALKDNGVETRFIAWPVKAHNATDPITQMERDRYWLEWMEKFLK
jgi:dipeptidyl aminopeptidase/acylaminoacyl peptidase